MGWSHMVLVLVHTVLGRMVLGLGRMVLEHMVLELGRTMPRMET